MNYNDNEYEGGGQGNIPGAGKGCGEETVKSPQREPENDYSRSPERVYSPESVVMPEYGNGRTEGAVKPQAEHDAVTAQPAEPPVYTEPWRGESASAGSGLYSYSGREIPSAGFYVRSAEPSSQYGQQYGSAQPQPQGDYAAYRQEYSQDAGQAAQRPAYTNRPQAKVSVKKKKAWLAPLSLVMVCLLIVGALSTAFLMNYDLGVKNENGSVDFSIKPKDKAPVIDDGTQTPSGGEATPTPNQGGIHEANPSASEGTLVPVVTDSKARELSIPEIYTKCISSVVGIESTLGRNGAQGTATGTGIIMSKDGYIVTNNHVISGATAVKVVFQSGEEYEAKIIGSDEKSDLAVMKIAATNLTPAEFGNSDTLIVGETVVAIGNPLGIELQGTVTDGIVSAINRNVEVEGRTMTLIQTNAAINPGNSGGPLINAYGQVIGINTLKMSDYYQNIEGLGFAIPASSVISITGELVEKGYISGRPSIGISCREITERAASYYNIPQGIQILSVDEMSDAYIKGVAVGDIITKFNDKEVKTISEMNALKEQYKAGDKVKLTLYRNGKTLDIEFKLMDEAVMSQTSIGENDAGQIPTDPFGGMWP